MIIVAVKFCKLRLRKILGQAAIFFFLQRNLITFLIRSGFRFPEINHKRKIFEDINIKRN